MQAKGLKPNHIEPKLILVASWDYLDDHRADLVHHGSRATQACREGQQGSQRTAFSCRAAAGA